MRRDAVIAIESPSRGALGRAHVVDLREPIAANRLCALPAGVRLQWRDPMPSAALDAIARWCHGAASIRLYGAACAQLTDVLERIPAQRVTDLALEGVPGDDAVLRAVPWVQTLRVDAHGAAFDLRLLDALPALRRLSLTAAAIVNAKMFERLANVMALEVSHCSLDEVESVMRCPSLAALRLATIDGVRSIRALTEAGSLRVLALDRLLHLDSLAPLETLPLLESLAIAGLWQFNVGDAECILRLPRLKRLAIDIGGKRKNVEITKRLQLPEPQAFDVSDYDFTTSYASGVHSRPANLSSVTTSGAAAGFCAENGGV